MRLSIIIVFSCLLTISFSQEETKTISLKDYLLLVKENHPVVKQAKNKLRSREAYLQEARGAFDPKFALNSDEKKFDDKNYYRLQEMGLKVPTWFGVELNADAMRSSGSYVNPENYVAQDALYQVGLKIPIGKNLFIDQRRASLMQAKNLVKLGENELILKLNELYFKAIVDYLEWSVNYNNYLVFQEAEGLAKFRLEGVKRAFNKGDKAAVDTLEAYIQMQNRSISKNEYFIKAQNYKYKVSTYLWNENIEPLEMQEFTVPEAIPDMEVPQEFLLNLSDTSIDGYFEAHPEIENFQSLIDNAEIERRLQFEQLKPQIDIKYNALTARENEQWYNELSTRDYKLGLTVSMPLLLRKERAKLTLSKINKEQLSLSRDSRKLDLKRSLLADIQAAKTYTLQNDSYLSNAKNYKRLLDAEQRKFNIGESSLFLVNSRENKWLEAKVKSNEVKSKLYESLISIPLLLAELDKWVEENN